ncbi:MAG: sugar phosphate isomerase/epimerase [Planctomycetes bacterium]|nr:sugar phosphate isomerase/epimerase [Planctomycetota bacterium]
MPTKRPLGFSFLYFAPRLTDEHQRWIDRAAHHGYDGVELPVNAATDAELAMLRRAAANAGLRTTAVGFCTPGSNPLAADVAERRAALEQLRTLAERARAIGADVLAGPMHSAYGVWTEAPPTTAERSRSAEVLRAAADYATSLGVRLAIEPLNRFESYFLTTARDCAELVRAVDHPGLTGALDTHHAHIEERDTAAAIAAMAGTLGHVQLSENHRGTPGSGQVDFAAVLAALDRIGYRGWLVVEAFSRQTPEFGNMLRVWRELDDGPDAVMAAGVAVARNARTG